MTYKVFLKANTPVGVFSGYATSDCETHEEAYDEMTNIQNMLRNCDSFTFFSHLLAGVEYTIATKTITNSVFEMSVQEIMPLK